MTRAQKSKAAGRARPHIQEEQGHKTSTRHTRWLIRASVALLLSAISTALSQSILSPVYGSIPSSRYHLPGLVTAVILGFTASPFTFDTRLSKSPSLLCLISAWTPVVQNALLRLSGRLSLPRGPALTECVTVDILVFLAVLQTCSAVKAAVAQKRNAALSAVVSLAPPAAFSLGTIWISKLALPTLKKLLTTEELQLAVTGALATLSPSKMLIFAVPAVLSTAWMNPHWMSSHGSVRLNTALAPYGFTVLDRRESNTGYISVLEQRQMFRVLRCDHSLLGGEWLVTPQARARGQKVTESVYPVFTMMEAARLVQRGFDPVDRESSALFIGLGAGMTTKAFINHGIQTTVVELDPVVHEFAVRYFGLPTNHTSHLQDAIEFVAKATKLGTVRYDYIVHDVFTGGAEPTALFTVEFLTGLKSLLNADGVIVVNYAADLRLLPAKIVLRTIHEVFPTCRIFQDVDPKTTDLKYINMVVFCTQTEAGTITFRDAVEADYLGSLSRAQYIPPSDKLEVAYGDVVNEVDDARDQGLVLRKGGEWRLEQYHHITAAEHWRIMRTVLPDAVWELW